MAYFLRQEKAALICTYFKNDITFRIINHLFLKVLNCNLVNLYSVSFHALVNTKVIIAYRIWKNYIFV